MDVGVYGPIAGYFASVIAVLLGFLLSHPASPDGPRALLQFGSPLTLALAHSALTPSHPGLSTFPALSRHPVLIAGWVGLFITALNLIPAGQLDGGHILYALTPRIHRHVTRYLPILLLVFGFIFWMGWILWALLLWLPALRHPKVMADQPLDRKRQALAVIALLILALTFTAAPFAGSSVLHYLQ
jgi:membrane-associated protease RseP (regulator of RpoE activity)